MDKVERLQTLLKAIVQEYIKTARPVGSKTLVDEYDFDYSPATIRNDMVVLEQAGLIAQPHTSAGRVPTEKGYQYYIENFAHRDTLTSKFKTAIDQQLKTVLRHREQHEHEQERMKELAKVVSDLTQETVVVSFAGNNFYYTGIAHLFRKPEFSDADHMMTLGDVFDHMDDVMQDMIAQMHDSNENMEVLIGEENPFSPDCSVIISEYQLPRAQAGVFGILGPMRMDYDTNIAIMRYMESVMKYDDDK